MDGSIIPFITAAEPAKLSIRSLAGLADPLLRAVNDWLTAAYGWYMSHVWPAAPTGRRSIFREDTLRVSLHLDEPARLLCDLIFNMKTTI